MNDLGKRQRTLTPKMKAYVEELDAKRATQLIKEEISREIASHGLLDFSKEFRQVNNSDNRTSVQLDPATIRTSSLAKHVFGEETVNNWVASGRTTRQIWELSTPRTQCTNIIKYDGTCWICGYAMKSKSGMNMYGPVCEHILPIAQASFFLGLFAYRNKDDISPGMKLEYGWAHRTCNAIKSNISFIKSTRDEHGIPTWEADTDNIRNVLTLISMKSHVPLGGVETRTTFIKDTNITPIINILQREPGIGNLIELAGYASLEEPSITRDIGTVGTKRARIGGQKRTKRSKTRRQKHRK